MEGGDSGVCGCFKRGGLGRVYWCFTGLVVSGKGQDQDRVRRR